MSDRLQGIILACENEDPRSLVNDVSWVLREKLIDAIDTKRNDIGKSLLEHSIHKGKDPYETYDPVVKEAIDYVVEGVLESGMELENTILMASKQYKVDEKELKEYFDTFLETTKTEVKVDSTSSDDEDGKRGMRDDEDTNKRVRYESTITFENGQHALLTEEFWTEQIEPVLQRLNETNREILMEYLTKDKVSFLKAVDFCQKVVKE